MEDAYTSLVIRAVFLHIPPTLSKLVDLKLDDSSRVSLCLHVGCLQLRVLPPDGKVLNAFEPFTHMVFRISKKLHDLDGVTFENGKMVKIMN